MKKIGYAIAALAIANAASAVRAEELKSGLVEFVTVSRQLTWHGTVEAVNESTVSAQTRGRIAELPFDVNDLVPSGAIIVRFTDTEQKEAVNNAKAGVEAAKSTLKIARQTLKRHTDLRDSKVISEAAFDQTNANFKGAEAGLKQSLATLKTARQQLAYTIIKAPYADILTQRHVELGEVVAPGSPLITGLSLEELRVVVDIPQNHILAIRQFQHAEIIRHDGSRTESTKLTIFPFADKISHTFRIRVRLPDGVTELYPGMSVKVAFKTGEQQKLLLPQRAIVRRSELTAVYLSTGDGTIRLRQIRTGAHFDDRVEVLAGLRTGERVLFDAVAAGLRLRRQKQAAQ